MSHLYQHAHDHAIFQRNPRRGILTLGGRDHTALIDRMSTNKLTALAPGEGAQTVLTTPVGRIIDLLLFLKQDEGALIITGEGRGETISTYLRRNIFFNDQVTVADAEQGLLAIYGGQAGALLGAEDLPRFAHRQTEHGLLVAVAPLGGGGYWLLGTPDQLDAAEADLRAGDALPADDDTVHLLHIEAGQPTPNELTDAYIPLEVGLWDAVSFNKGCYTGQEIIARLESRGKLAKMLLRLAPQTDLAPGSPLLAEGKKVGQVTSIAAHPKGGYVALGVAKPAVLEAASDPPLTNQAGEPIPVMGVAGTQPGRT